MHLGQGIGGNRPSGGLRSALLLGAAVTISVLAQAGCGSGRGGAQIDFRIPAEETPAVTPASSTGGTTIRIAVAPVLSPRETFNSGYRDLLDYMGEKLGRPVEFVQGKTYAEINDLVRTGDVTLAFVCTNPYLQGRDDFGMEALVVPQVKGAVFYYSYLIVHKDAAFRSLTDLRNRTFAFSDPLSNSGRLAPVYELAQMGESPESFFRRYIFTYAHDNSIKAVAEGLVDAAAVDSLVYDYWVASGSEYTSKTAVIEAWGPFGINPVVVRPGLDPALKQELRDLLLGMDQDPRGREILRSLLIDRFVVPDDSIYDSVRNMREFMASIGLGQ